MKKILTVLGARPQFIKASAVSRSMSLGGALSEIVVHTGQHFDANMSDVFFSELGLAAPKYNLGIHGGAHGAMIGQMLAGIEEILLKEKPHAVLVYGDTNSADDEVSITRAVLRLQLSARERVTTDLAPLGWAAQADHLRGLYGRVLHLAPAASAS